MKRSSNITIGITCYREGEWLRECWESVLAQTDERWEAIMVIDGDADKQTLEIFNAINHSKLQKYSMKKNVGLYLCRTIAILNTETDWYIPLDADDLLPENAIALILDAIQKNSKAQFVYGDVVHFSKERREIREGNPENAEALLYGPNVVGTTPFRRSIFFKLGGYSPEFLSDAADWDLWLTVYEQHITGVRADGITYLRRVRANSMGSTWFLNRDQVVKKMIEKHPDFFIIKDRSSQSLGKAYELIARAYRTQGKRKLAAEYARLAEGQGVSTATMKAIREEEKMGLTRYFFRRFGRLISKPK